MLCEDKREKVMYRGISIEDTMVHELKDVQNRGNEKALPGGVHLDQAGLVVPKKLHNPCKDSKECQDLNREIKWNARAGINVLAGKTELEKAMEKRNRHRQEQEKISEEKANKTPFQKMLEERAKKLEEVVEKVQTEDCGNSSSEDSGHCSPEPESEFLKVHAQLRGRGGNS